MRTIRASEIGAYLYCRRSWWYRRQGYPPENQEALAAGLELHERHGRAVMTAGCLRLLAYAILLAGLVILAIYVTGLFI